MDLTALQAEVARNQTLTASAIAQLEAAKADPAKIQAIVDTLRASDDALAAAVQVNTPAVPPAP